MKIVYLVDGQACYLKEKIGNKYIVNRIFQYQDDDMGIIDIEDPNDIVVDAIFEKPPVSKISAEVKELQKKKKEIASEVTELESKIYGLNSQITQLTRTQISNDKFIINKTDLINAKSLALFPKDRAMPYTMLSSEKNFRGLKITFEIELSTSNERRWGCKLYHDYGNSSGDFLCEKYGILINPTQEEIDEVIKKRLQEFEFTPNQIKNVDDKYLTQKLLQQKIDFIASEKLKEKEKLEKLILDSQIKLNMLS
jgi:phenylpyruvate tautomerase PptA (4-oxalocrotonate tautomerase family)